MCFHHKAVIFNALHKAQAAVSYSSMKQQCSVLSLYHPNVLNYTDIIKQ